MTGPLLGRTGASLTVADAASRVHVVLATMPGLLYRISTPAHSGLAPRVTRRDGRVLAALVPTGDDGPHEVRIVLNRGVRWSLRLPAGAGEQRLDLARGRLARVDLGASGLIEMRLPPPSGTVPLVVTGGVGTLAVTVPRGAPVRLRLAGGAGSALTPWTADEELPPRTTLGPAIWPTARNRYALRARAPIGILSLRANTEVAARGNRTATS
ncbi:hypothetical protein [Actinoplanes sp. URMC 104]|uniref:hypothetical protein n=1 Tax=Actinoplanes sp. URMC 104 TaxID=3423409 RepID=UPI003F1DF3E8